MHLNLTYRWFCHRDPADPVPIHSTFSKNRNGCLRESRLLHHLFETAVARFIADGLVSGQHFAADASLIEADANKQNSTAKEDWDTSAITPQYAPHALREYIDVLDDAAFGAASEVKPKFRSHSDPASQWTAARKEHEDARQVAQNIAKTKQYLVSMRPRKKVAMLFAPSNAFLG